MDELGFLISDPTALRAVAMKLEGGEMLDYLPR